MLEETGIAFEPKELSKVLESETYYDDFYNYRNKTNQARHTITTYFYVKTDKQINLDNLDLTETEKQQNFKIKFVDRNTLYSLLTTDHSKEENGKFFDEESRIVMNNVLKLIK